MNFFKLALSWARGSARFGLLILSCFVTGDGIQSFAVRGTTGSNLVCYKLSHKAMIYNVSSEFSLMSLFNMYVLNLLSFSSLSLKVQKS